MNEIAVWHVLKGAGGAIVVGWFILSLCNTARADNTPGTDMTRLIQAEERQAEALEKIAAELREMKGKCK